MFERLIEVYNLRKVEFRSSIKRELIQKRKKIDVMKDESIKQKALNLYIELWASLELGDAI